MRKGREREIFYISKQSHSYRCEISAEALESAYDRPFERKLFATHISITTFRTILDSAKAIQSLFYIYFLFVCVCVRSECLVWRPNLSSQFQLRLQCTFDSQWCFLHRYGNMRHMRNMSIILTRLRTDAKVMSLAISNSLPVIKGIIRPFKLKEIDLFNYLIDPGEFSYSNHMH